MRFGVGSHNQIYDRLLGYAADAEQTSNWTEVINLFADLTGFAQAWTPPIMKARPMTPYKFTRLSTRCGGLCYLCSVLARRRCATLLYKSSSTPSSSSSWSRCFLRVASEVWIVMD